MMVSARFNAALVSVGLLELAGAASILRNNGISVQVPASVPDAASDTVDLDFAGLAFEQASWSRYALDDDGNTNQFTVNLMDSIYSRTGGKPIIRLGGTSPDYGRYLPGQEEPALPIAEQDNYQDIGGTTIGPSYWPIAKRFPEAKYMIQVPLATTNMSEAVAWAIAAIDGIGIDQIHSIQPGNEPDLYRDDFTGEGGQYLGPPDYQGTLTNESYVGNYTNYVSAIKEAIDLPEKLFTAFDVAAHVDTPHVAQWLLSPEFCFPLGIDENNNTIKEVAHHYYQNHAGQAEDLEEGLMTMNLTHTNLDYLKPRINWLRDNRPDVPFIINEIGNSLEPTNSYEYQARLGSALWAVDFYLYSLTIGVKRFNYQQIMHSGFDMWLPVASAGYEAQVFSNFYSHPFLADFVGPSGDTRVSKIELREEQLEEHPNLAVYAAWEGGEARRLAVANLDYWNRTSSYFERPVATLSIELGESVETVMVTHLNSPDGAGAPADTITYEGSQWTYESLGKEVKGVREDTEEIRVEDGIAVVHIQSSEAVIIYLNRGQGD